MTLGPAPDWQHISWMVGNYNGEPILVTVDGLGQLIGGLTAYYDRYSVKASGTSAGVDMSGFSGIVPAGEVWIITNISAYHTDTIPRKVQVFLRYDTTDILLFGNSFLLENEVLERQGNWILKQGDYIKILFTTVTSGKTINYSVAGYKVKVFP